MTIYFVGYILAGKKKWAQKLAVELNCNFVDTREMMVEKTGVSYDNLLKDKELFIETEQEIVAEISKMKNTIVATSELLPCRNDNMDILNKNGLTIYLRAGLGCIMMKVSKLKIYVPLIHGIPPDIVPDFINTELARRKPFYKKAQIETLARELSMKKLLNLIN